MYIVHVHCTGIPCSTQGILIKQGAYKVKSELQAVKLQQI